MLERNALGSDVTLSLTRSELKMLIFAAELESTILFKSISVFLLNTKTYLDFSLVMEPEVSLPRVKIPTLELIRHLNTIPTSHPLY